MRDYYINGCRNINKLAPTVNNSTKMHSINRTTLTP